MPGGSGSGKGWLCTAFSRLFSLLFPSLLSGRKGQGVMLLGGGGGCCYQGRLCQLLVEHPFCQAPKVGEGLGGGGGAREMHPLGWAALPSHSVCLQGGTGDGTLKGGSFPAGGCRWVSGGRGIPLPPLRLLYPLSRSS